MANLNPLGIDLTTGQFRAVAASDTLSTGTGAAILATSGMVDGVKVVKNSNQVISAGVQTDVIFDTSDTEVFDTANYHNPSSNPARLTVPVGKAGKYLVTAGNLGPAGQSTANHNSLYLTQFASGGSTKAFAEGRHVPLTAGGSVAQCVLIADAAEGDYFISSVYFANTGVTIDADTRNFFSALLVGPSAQVDFQIAGGRLTLSSTDPAPSADQTAKTTLYYLPYQTDQIALYNGSSWNLRAMSSSGISLAVASFPY